MSTVGIRLATIDDVGAINEIYNHYVLTSPCTFHTEPVHYQERLEWFEKHGPRHPVIVATIEANIVGWASLSAYRERPAYNNTAESSVYIHKDHHRKGIGRMLMDDLLVRAREIGFHTVLAGVTGCLPPSIELHRSLGFEQVACLREVGFKFGKWHDVVFLQLMLEST